MLKLVQSLRPELKYGPAFGKNIILSYIRDLLLHCLDGSNLLLMLFFNLSLLLLLAPTNEAFLLFTLLLLHVTSAVA